MRLIKSNFIMLAAICFVGSMQVAATQANRLSPFNPGSYELIQGNINECGGQNIQITGDGLDLAIEPYHFFRTSYEKDSFTEGQCTFNMESTVDKKSNRTTLKYQENVNCEDSFGVGYNKLVKTLSITRSYLYMLVEEDNGEGHSYDCKWVLKE